MKTTDHPRRVLTNPPLPWQALHQCQHLTIIHNDHFQLSLVWIILIKLPSFAKLSTFFSNFGSISMWWWWLLAVTKHHKSDILTMARRRLWDALILKDWENVGIFLACVGINRNPSLMENFLHFLCFKRTASLYFAARWGRGVRSPLSSTVAPAPHIGPCPLAWNFAALATYQELSFRTYLRSLQCCASPWTSLLSDFEFQLDLLIRSLDWISLGPMAVFVWGLSLGFVAYSYVCENVFFSCPDFVCHSSLSHSLIHYKDLFSFFLT